MNVHGLTKHNPRRVFEYVKDTGYFEIAMLDTKARPFFEVFQS